LPLTFFTCGFFRNGARDDRVDLLTGQLTIFNKSRRSFQEIGRHRI
jgi:hypothetical protein